MHNKVLLTCLTALAVGIPGSFAQAPAAAPAAAPAVSVTATAAVSSTYMFRGQRLSAAAFQPAVEMASGDLTLGAWSNFPFDGDKVPDSSDPEIDLYGSYTFKLGENLSLAPGFTSYHYPKAPESLGFYRWTFEPNVALNYTVSGFKLTPKIYYDTVLEGFTYEITGFYAVPLKDIGTELDFVATAGTFKLKDAGNDVSPALKSVADYWLVGVSMPFQLAPNQKLTIGFAYTEGRNAFFKQGSAPKFENTLAVSRGVATIAYSFSF